MQKETVFITGASSGIGAATARLLGREGYEVILAARRENILEDITGEIKQAGGQADYYQLDLADEESIEKCAKKVLHGDDKPDVLINNAGYGIYGLAEDVPVEEARQLFETNFFGALSLTRQLLGPLKRSENGRIINVTSGVAKRGFPVMNYYAASKAALESMSESLKEELEPYDICVQVVYPLRTETSFSAAARRYVPDDFSFPSHGPTQGARKVARAIYRGMQGTGFRIHPHYSTKLLGVLNEICPGLTAKMLKLKQIVSSALGDN